MVYKIRNKSFFWTRAGWKNNWHPKNFNAPRPSSSEFTIGIRCRYDHNSFLRAYHSYRKISRHCKQYFFGNKELEELFQMGLRTFFIVPHIAECQVTQIKHGGERRMVDQIDRDFELVSYNSHPYQLFTYTIWNQYLANQQEAYEQRKNGGQAIEDQVIDHISELVKDEKAKLGAGKQLSIERTAEIVMNVMRQLRAAQQRPNLNNRRADGEFDDFLEQRRPFTAPNNQSATH
ncbi:unnamed protein product (macronuclear) [Paramecium tetraurelia]|uniref:Uncharacterized protein n=1 Tax=Paramecium tetraurelia TaxID=5888 RepID=A0DXT8_PARTE|nr:uncharacterized protein GSPATT00021479001 [Paramecium tetraurelia]CAK87855.1 unnamed protein product [Paramecium tetraurelia]|eukprot:XP_001455252.1 hypothetical protein (macronuclear) [Paramecium tetraurelia strain d4-2]